MSPLFKSYIISLTIHASVIVGLYAISDSQRYTTSGSRNLVSIEFTQSHAAPTSAISFSSPAMESATDLQEDEPTMLPFEPSMTDYQREIAQIDPQRFDSQRSSLELPNPSFEYFEQPMPDFHRHYDERFPTPAPVVPPRRRPIITSSITPAPAAIPMEQFAGLDKETAVDFSGNPPPTYPTQAIQQRWQGTVLVRMTISNTGEVKKVEMIESSGHTVLDQAAIDAVSGWQGKPATRWSRPIESIELLPIRFRL